MTKQDAKNMMVIRAETLMLAETLDSKGDPESAAILRGIAVNGSLEQIHVALELLREALGVS